MASPNSISTRRPYSGTLYFVALLNRELGERIKTARIAADMTQRELADAIHLKNATDVSRYERGVTEVPSHRIDLIAEATGRPRSYFTRDPSEAEPVDDGRLDRLEAQQTEALDLLREVRNELLELRASREAGAAAPPQRG